MKKLLKKLLKKLTDNLKERQMEKDLMGSLDLKSSTGPVPAIEQSELECAVINASASYREHKGIETEKTHAVVNGKVVSVSSVHMPKEPEELKTFVVDIEI